MPLTETQIESQLVKAGFEFVDQTKYRSLFRKTSSNLSVYVRRETKPCLVIDPAYVSILNDLRKLDGVVHRPGRADQFHHGSNMTMFPKKLNTGKTKIHYGLAFEFDTNRSFAAFICML